MYGKDSTHGKYSRRLLRKSLSTLRGIGYELEHLPVETKEDKAGAFAPKIGNVNNFQLEFGDIFQEADCT